MSRRTLHLVLGVDEAGPPDPDVDVVVLDSSWTPAPGDRADIAPIRPRLHAVLDRVDLFDGSLERLDAWAEATGLADRLVANDVTWWFRIRMVVRWDLHERMLWRYVLGDLLSNGAYGRIVLPAERQALVDVARAASAAAASAAAAGVAAAAASGPIEVIEITRPDVPAPAAPAAQADPSSRRPGAPAEQQPASRRCPLPNVSPESGGASSADCFDSRHRPVRASWPRCNAPKPSAPGMSSWTPAFRPSPPNPAACWPSPPPISSRFWAMATMPGSWIRTSRSCLIG